MITKHQVCEENKRILVEFRDYLEQEEEDEGLIDLCMGDVSLYALDYSAEYLNGASIENINVFDIHCFLADYMIRHIRDCSVQTVARVLDSICVFAEFMERSGTINVVDLEEILDLCEDAGQYVARLEEYQALQSAHDPVALKRWREKVLDAFETDI